MRAPTLLLLLLLAACDSSDPVVTGPPAPSSLEGSILANGDFEAGRVPWFTFEYGFWGSFHVVNAGPVIGKVAGELTLDQEGFIREGSRVASMIQDVEVDLVPRRLRGRYFVAEWTPGAAAPWIEVVVGVKGADTKPKSGTIKMVAFPLAGQSEDFKLLGNRVAVPSASTTIETGRWIDFDLPLLDVYTREWRAASAATTGLRVWATVRVEKYDREKQGAFKARLRFDDLYLGD